jgi:hypothetical protein
MPIVLFRAIRFGIVSQSLMREDKMNFGGFCAGYAGTDNVTNFSVDS